MASKVEAILQVGLSNRAKTEKVLCKCDECSCVSNCEYYSETMSGIIESARTMLYDEFALGIKKTLAAFKCNDFKKGEVEEVVTPCFGTWTPVENGLPKSMVDVLICDNDGRVLKAHINLGGIWRVQNSVSMYSWFFRDEASVVAWMPMPTDYREYADGWNLPKEKLPEDKKYVLATTSYDKDSAYVAYYCESNETWFMDNASTLHKDWKFLSGVAAWMPLPESFVKSE